MPVLPFHNYIGPGNDINSGPCIDEDDCIAKKHDIKYENAKTPQDVRLADVEAIDEFRRNWMSGNWHSIIGDVGLSLKYCVETYTGVIYPKLHYEPCEIVTLFHDVIKLHCVNKERLVKRFRRDIRNTQTEKHDFIKNKNYESLENFFYILVIWYTLNYKNQKISQYNLLNTTLTKYGMHDFLHDAMLKKVKCFPLSNSSLVNNCDVFNINAWIRFFSVVQRTQHTPSNYNDEALSSMFMNYD